MSRRTHHSIISTRLGCTGPLDLGGLSADRIVVCKRGGLGNQLFQYAAALQGRRLTGARLAFTKTDDDLRSRDIQLEDLVGELPAAGARDMAAFLWPPPWSPLWVSRWNRRLRRRLGIGRVVWRVEDGIMEQIEASFFGRYLLFDGLFQSPGCFEPTLPEVVEHILRQRPAGADDAPDAIAVSFRLGEDFTSLGWSLPWDFYRQAIDRLDPESQRVLWPVSDVPLTTPRLAQFLASLGRRVEVPAAVGTSKSLSDFWNLARAAKVVLSPSTFAWWAAVVGDRIHSGRTEAVVFPDPWYPREKAFLRRPGWEKIKRNDLEDI